MTSLMLHDIDNPNSVATLYDFEDHTILTVYSGYDGHNIKLNQSELTRLKEFLNGLPIKTHTVEQQPL